MCRLSQNHYFLDIAISVQIMPLAWFQDFKSFSYDSIFSKFIYSISTFIFIPKIPYFIASYVKSSRKEAIV